SANIHESARSYTDGRHLESTTTKDAHHGFTAHHDRTPFRSPCALWLPTHHRPQTSARRLGGRRCGASSRSVHRRRTIRPCGERGPRGRRHPPVVGPVPSADGDVRG